ncbi:MAG: hypothetical protein JXM79_23770 [Sedimentisphaerales bacterium]|nr:hypothetical protein [Sedimentisphaerales bacterium]
MCKHFFGLACFILALSLVGSVSAQLPAGWQSQDINTTGGSASESGGTWSIRGDGADVWGTTDAFHYAYVPLGGGGEITARVVSNGTGSNTWSKGGVMIRETLDAGSKHAIMALTGGDGSGIAFQSRPTTGGSSISFHGDITASPPHWIKLGREGNTITAYHSDDGVTWELFTDASPDGGMSNPIDIDMADDIYIGLFVTSHAAGEQRTYTFDNVLVGLPVAAYGPVPANGAIHPDTWASLSWQPGSTAASHDVYFGENFDDVNDGTGDTFLGNQPANFFVVGFPGFPYPDGLVPGTTYYWRVDEVEADGVTKYPGKVWSFTVPSLTAYDPVPADGSVFIALDSTLSWSKGFNAKLHTVYFGTDFDTVANAAGGMPQALETYNPGPLGPSTTYYWRVDEFDGASTHKGDVWSFTTAREGGGLKGEYFNNTELSGQPILTRTDPQINFYWNPGPVGPGVNEDNFSVRWTGVLEAPFSEPFTFTIGCDDGARMYLNGELIIDDWGAGHDYTETRSQPIDLVAGQHYPIVVEGFELTGEAEWRLFWESSSLPRDYVPQAALLLPVKASGPYPANGSDGASLTPILTWNAGDDAASHEVYFGTDADAVANATTASPEFKATKALGDESYDPGKLAWHTTYYWRVDEVNDLHPDSPWIGNLWSFTTGDFLLVDDFESYTDDDTSGEAIWQHWIDGYGVAGNGSQVGYLMPPYAEQAIVHGGRQSMPLMYDNTGGVLNSEAELTLTYPRDWTEEGVSNLSLWFHGLPGSVGSFVEAPAGTYTMTASGTDIWNVGTAGDYHDEFHFAYKTLTGAGSITARVVSVQNTNAWAKAGVMIRETLDGGSKHAFACITPGSGVASQGRLTTGGDSFNYNQTGITVPCWIKVERDAGGSFTVQHSTNGTSWQPVQDSTPQMILMGSNVYIGLALTSHDAALTCEAVFTNVTTTGNVSGQWAHQDIGIASNAAEPLYVAFSNTSGTPAVIVNGDPAAATIDDWVEWIIPLQDIADQGINLRNVDGIAIGLGNKGGVSPGGSGTIYIDDIRLNRAAP